MTGPAERSNPLKDDWQEGRQQGVEDGENSSALTVSRENSITSPQPHTPSPSLPAPFALRFFPFPLFSPSHPLLPSALPLPPLFSLFGGGK